MAWNGLTPFVFILLCGSLFYVPWSLLISPYFSICRYHFVVGVCILALYMQFLFVRAEISMLEEEKQELLKELRLAESRSNQVRDEEHTDTLVTLLEAKG